MLRTKFKLEQSKLETDVVVCKGNQHDVLRLQPAQRTARLVAAVCVWPATTDTPYSTTPAAVIIFLCCIVLIMLLILHCSCYVYALFLLCCLLCIVLPYCRCYDITHNETLFHHTGPWHCCFSIFPIEVTLQKLTQPLLMQIHHGQLSTYYLVL